MTNEIINKYKNLGIHIEKTKSRQEIFINVYQNDSSLLTTAVFSQFLQKRDLKEY
ncbi:Lmo0850 family protein [Peribacillus sp. NPDC096540]|uniref:Lmo0850 family protein n=1 Tax=Peribacillus sp. NPDC096540 TaxID=3390612 RepID=UPI003D092AC5